MIYRYIKIFDLFGLTGLFFLSCNNNYYSLKYLPVNFLTHNYNDSIVKLEYLTGSNFFKNQTQSHLIYYWVSNDSIYKTQGNFSGKLLHGNYMIFYPSGQLKTKGCFHFGLKDGEWMYWNIYGTLQKTENWKAGLKDGETKIYNVEGRLISVTNFKEGLKHGWAINYDNTEIREKIRFKKGIEK